MEVNCLILIFISNKVNLNQEVWLFTASHPLLIYLKAEILNYMNRACDFMPDDFAKQEVGYISPYFLLLEPLKNLV